ncbi:SDR family NAD(P)-dependent oxidoreductase [Piscinibacter sakaiensis]|uniref:SDR family NAD(P)-dependent oxidoreductase n=1 Tax=Piscinibacter sakaiensis TaxID=1547922 RepID=UPI003AAB8586
MLLKDKVTIITGAASLRGIGWATAKRFADEGARVALLDIDAAGAERAAKEIGAQHRGYGCDVRNEQACRDAVQAVLRDFGQVDVLVNNAGVSQAHRLLDSSQDDWDLVMDVSARGAFNMSRSVVPHMRERRSGAIVNIGSVAAQRGGGILGGPHYAAAKGASQTLAKSMARELAPDGIRANAIAPGLVDTDLLIGKLDDAGKGRVAESTPLGRVAVPLDIANACLFLASDLSAFVTGIVLDVNGGLHIH